MSRPFDTFWSDDAAGSVSNNTLRGQVAGQDNITRSTADTAALAYMLTVAWSDLNSFDLTNV